MGEPARSVGRQITKRGKLYGHGLIDRGVSTEKVAVARCRCGAESDPLPHANARVGWHRQHKVLAAASGMPGKKAPRNKATKAEAIAADIASRDRSDCWIWVGSRLPKGYGSLGFDGKTALATHVSLILSGKDKPMPPRNFALHSCDNPPCYNPDHLRWGTAAENSADMVAKGRSHHQRGELSGKAKLTEAIVLEIRRRAALGEAQASIAHEMAVSPNTISGIVQRKRWAHVA